MGSRVHQEKEGSVILVIYPSGLFDLARDRSEAAGFVIAARNRGEACHLVPVSMIEAAAA